MDAEENQYMMQMQEQLEGYRQGNNNLSSSMQNQIMYNNQENRNLIEWQLDLSEHLDQLAHQLKGEFLGQNEKGETVYLPQTNPDLQPFNNFGVQVIMNFIAFYLNRNTILSNYDEETINFKVYQFGLEIADLIFNRYEDMMNTLDIVKIIEDLTNEKVYQLPNGHYVTSFQYIKGRIVYTEISPDIIRYIDEMTKNHLSQKLKIYPIMVNALTDTIHSAYNRAIFGEEKKSLNTARLVTQNEPIYRSDPQNTPQMRPPQNNHAKAKWYNPASWGS